MRRFLILCTAVVTAGVFVLLGTTSTQANLGGGDGDRSVFFAHEGINIRGGPGLKHAIIGRLAPGESVEIVQIRGEWGEIRRGKSKGYVLLRLLKEENIPPLQIVNWKWRKAPRIGRSGVVVWTVEVRNNSAVPVDHVRVEFLTLDRKGRRLENAVTHLRGIQPGKVVGSRSFASYTGREASARVTLLCDEARFADGQNKNPPQPEGGGGRGGLSTEADED